MNRFRRLVRLPLLSLLLCLLPGAVAAQSTAAETAAIPRQPTARDALDTAMRLRFDDMASARVWFDTALALDSSLVEAWWRRGRLRGCRLNDPNGGLQDINEALRREPNSIDALSSRGHILAEHLKQKDQGESDYVRALRLCRSRLEKYPDVISDVFGEVEGGRVMAELDDALAAPDPPGYAWFARGRMHFEAERFDAARADFERAVAGVPGDTRPYLFLGSTHVQLGDTDRALAAYDEAVRRFPLDRHARLWRLALLTDCERWSELLEDGDRLLELDSSALHVHSYRALALLELGRESEALAALDAIDESDTRFESTRTWISEILLDRFFEERRDSDFLAVYWRAPARPFLFARVLARSAGGFVMAQILFIVALTGGTLLAVPLLFRRPPGLRLILFAAVCALSIALMEYLATLLVAGEASWNDRFLIAGTAFGNACIAAACGGLMPLAASGARRTLAVASAGIGLMFAWSWLLFAAMPITLSPFILDLAERLPAGNAAALLGAVERPLAAILVAVAAALREEILCRGLFLPLCYGLLAGLPAPGRPLGAIRVAPWTLASLAVGSLWAIAHAGMVDPEWIKFVQILGLAVVLGEIQRREGVVACLMTHGLFNLLAILAGIAGE